MDNEFPDEFSDIMGDAFASKVWEECQEGFSNLTLEEQATILNTFEQMIDTYGLDSTEVSDYFESCSMKFSKTYYFIHALLASDRDEWDEAFNQLV